MVSHRPSPVPRLSWRFARIPAVDVFHESREHVRIGLRENAMSEVEGVTTVSCALFEESLGLAPRWFVSRDDQRRIKVALECMVLADARRGVSQRGAPIDADHIGPCLCHQVKQLSCADSEMDTRTPGRSDSFKDLGR